MSHYARTVAPFEATTERGIEAIPVGLEVKSIALNDDGTYRFWVRFYGRWESATTAADLPACTDRGRAHIAEGKIATMRKGRPTRGVALRQVALKLEVTQHDWLTGQAALEHLTVSEYVRRALEREGMPR